MSLKVFISKPIEEVEALKYFCKERDWKLIAHSFLTFEPTPFIWGGEEEIIFFSSPRAVDFFQEQFPLPKDKVYACAGRKTQEKLSEYGLHADFAANHSGLVDTMAKEFAAFAKGKQVVFPISNLSRQSYSQYLKEGSFRFVQVYATNIKAKVMEDCDLYIFTSPSNIKGFLMDNSPHAKPCISWGETTSKFLDKKGFQVFEQLKISSIDYLIETLVVLTEQQIKHKFYGG